MLYIHITSGRVGTMDCKISLWVLLVNFNWLIVQAFQRIIFIFIKCNFVYQYWGCKCILIYCLLSYPLRSLLYTQRPSRIYFHLEPVILILEQNIILNFASLFRLFLQQLFGRRKMLKSGLGSRDLASNLNPFRFFKKEGWSYLGQGQTSS